MVCWQITVEDFIKQTKIRKKCKELAYQLYQAIPEIFPRKMDWTKIQQCKKKTVFYFSEHFK